MAFGLCQVYNKLICRRWQDVDGGDDVLRVVAKPVLPPLISCTHLRPSPRLANARNASLNTNTAAQPNKVVGKKGAPELVAVGTASSLGSSGPALVLPSMSADPLLRITQLEQNIRFLHEQHQLMLASLHQEIEVLRQRNRDLQFQLVFTKKNSVYGNLTSSDSSPEEENKSKLTLSPKQMNPQNLQVEILEREIAELKTALNDANETNEATTKELEEVNKQVETFLGKEADYESRLDDADKLIRRLRKEIDDQRREMNSYRMHHNKRDGGNPGGGRHHGNGGGRRSGGNSRGDRDDGQRFPPLHSQYWQRNRPGPQDYGQGQSGRGGDMGEGSSGENGGASSLPHLAQPPPPQRHYKNQPGGGGGGRGGNRYYSNSNHYYNNRGGGGGGGGSGGSNPQRGGGAANHREQSQ
ncbi:hypothetical protein LSTR_LSTR011728 [Laodelphax striatellus]|uniref:CCDC92/74 N-terminal domain-containing protein n=1 Tax=Laodelphax striatellus TaxID=195883 RepID=A0A482WML4_LAOST|nr:hypothetical protein LSTR_LSTR011728 [Laodelphax striatellus]